MYSKSNVVHACQNDSRPCENKQGGYARHYKEDRLWLVKNTSYHFCNV